MTGPSPEALIAQLKELNERIRTYGRQIWQMSFAYVIASGAALSQLPGKDRLSPVVLPLALFAIGIVGIFTWRHCMALLLPDTGATKGSRILRGSSRSIRV